MKTLVLYKDVLESLSYIAILLGIPVGIFQYYRAKKREQLDREYGTYNSLDEKYLEFLNLCFQYPHLNIFDIRDQSPSRLDNQQIKQELIAFTILFSIFERAYLMYHDQSTETKRKQWSGWEEYVGDYCVRENFRSAWSISGKTFDMDYQSYMEKRMKLPVL
jgi:hypothetical protein